MRQGARIILKSKEGFVCLKQGAGVGQPPSVTPADARVRSLVFQFMTRQHLKTRLQTQVNTRVQKRRAGAKHRPKFKRGKSGVEVGLAYNATSQPSSSLTHHRRARL
jgi:hypothetical protein